MVRVSAVQNFKQRLVAGPSGRVFKGMVVLGLGAGAARIVGLLSIPVLTRLYTPGDYGLLAIFTGFVLILAPFLTGRYAVVLPLPRSNGAAANVLALSSVLLVTASIIVLLTLWLFAEPVLALFSATALAPFWWAIGIGASVVAAYELLTMWATRRRAYAIIAKTQAYQATIGEGLKIFLGAFGLGPTGLILGQVAGQGAGSLTIARAFGKDLSHSRSRISFARMKLIAGYYREFPIFRLPSQMLLAFSTQAPLLLAAYLFDAETTGQLALATMAVAMPLNLLGHAVGRAYYGEAARLRIDDPAAVAPLTRSIQLKLLLFAIGPVAVLFFFGQSLFSAAFGPQWAQAGSFAAQLAPMLLLQFTSAPLMQSMNLYRGQVMFLAINFVRVLVIGCIFAWSQFNDVSAHAFVLVLSWSMAAFYAGVTLYVIRVVSLHSKLLSNRLGNA